MPTDLFLIGKIKQNNCENSLKELIDRHSRLCFDIYHKYLPAIKASGMFPDDAINEKDYIIYKSAISFNPEKKTKFSTWLGNQIRYNCLNKINKSKPHMLLEDEESEFLIEKNDKPNLAEIKEYIINILDQLKDERIRRIFEIRYFSGTRKCVTWEKIGLRLKMSSQTAINLHNRGKKILLKKMTSKRTFRADFI